MNETRPRGSKLLAAAEFALIFTAAWSARAQTPDEHTATAALVATIERDRPHAAVTADAILHAKEALERATRFRSTADELHAKAADGLAREWAETARDLVRAADQEAAASDQRRKAVEAQARLDRVRALVEEGIARVGRLRSEIEEASRTTGKERVAVEVHDGDRAAGRKKVDEKKTEEKAQDKPGREGRP